MSRVSIPELFQKKANGERIVVITAYDFPTASAVSKAGVDIILVGDSLGTVFQGHDTTVFVTMEQMIYHCSCVVRGNKRAFVVADMPFMSYETSVKDAVRNAGRLVKEGGADAVKLEGGIRMVDKVKSIVRAGIPVMGHVGLTPQSATMLGGYKVQGKDISSARAIVEDAIALEEAGVFSIVLESVPTGLARIITKKVQVPTIGIGAGPFCDGQVLVFHDMVGLFKAFRPKFVKVYAELYEEIVRAVSEYKDDVVGGRFPDDSHSFSMNEGVLKELEEEFLR